MSHLIKAGLAIGALFAPTMQAEAAVDAINIDPSEHHSASAIPTAGRATPGQVKASMRQLGMTVLDTPVTSLLSGANRVAASESAAAIWCNSNWCISPKPDSKLTTSVRSAEGVLERSRQNGTATFASLLDEVNKTVKPGDSWSITLVGPNQFVLG